MKNIPNKIAYLSLRRFVLLPALMRNSKYQPPQQKFSAQTK